MSHQITQQQQQQQQYQHQQNDIAQELKEQCGICQECLRILLKNPSQIEKANNVNHKITNNNNNEENKKQAPPCTTCFGMLTNQTFHSQILSEIQNSFEPYGGISNNHISKDSPTVVPPPAILVRAHCVLAAMETAAASSDADGATCAPDDDDDDDSAASQSLASSSPRHLKEKKSNLRRGGDTFQNFGKSSSPAFLTCHTAGEFYVKVKERLRNILRDMVDKINDNNGNNNFAKHIPLTEKLHGEEAGYMSYHILLTTPSSSSPSIRISNDGKKTRYDPFQLPTGILPLKDGSSLHRRERKRFRGNDPTEKQGGDPRANLEKRVRYSILSSSSSSTTSPQECEWLEKSAVQRTLESLGERPPIKKQMGEWIVQYCKDREECVFQTTTSTTSRIISSDVTEMNGGDDGKTNDNGDGNGIGVEIHTAAWRNHFYLRGKYTKARRDVSQTPFYVPNDGRRKTGGNTNVNVNSVDASNRETVTTPIESTTTDKNASGILVPTSDDNDHAQIKLGISSVEEEICPIIAQLGCKGISTTNNEPDTKPSQDASSNVGKIVYGMCKFHASGREDMDVRMIISKHKPNLSPLASIGNSSKATSPSSTTSNMLGIKEASGRPFVCEVIDAHRMPTVQDLRKIVKAINHLTNESSENNAVKDNDNGELAVDQEFDNYIQYGCNPNGVGISSLTYCPSFDFKNLQSDTEDKVKFYGCLCWSELSIHSQKYLEEKLLLLGSNGSENNGCSNNNDNDTNDAKSTNCSYPLRIEQNTPLRVLHRRSAQVRIRHVLSMRAIRIDNHYFRLHLSTSAGTYVKEFVHGDCGRTVPSVSSLMSCKTDILELDCEGIAA